MQHLVQIPAGLGARCRLAQTADSPRIDTKSTRNYSPDLEILVVDRILSHFFYSLIPLVGCQGGQRYEGHPNVLCRNAAGD